MVVLLNIDAGAAGKDWAAVETAAPTKRTKPRYGFLMCVNSKRLQRKKG
jgi:hypothetical protein